MAVRSPALAKLTRPKLYDALPRPRLFSLLDEAAARPIVWITAPTGSGKSTLALSFVPFALIGAVGGLAVFQRLSQKQFQVAVSLLLAVSGVGLLVRGL